MTADTGAVPLVVETGIDLQPDHRRVIARLFVPGREDMGAGDSRATPVLERILQVEPDDVEATMGDIDQRFAQRHRDLHQIFRSHAAAVTSRVDSAIEISSSRQLLIGASFTHEYAIEGASVCNPSAVLHPQQDSDDARFIMSVRGIGEGHRSSIGFRTGSVTAAGVVTLDTPGPFAQIASSTPALHHRSVFHARLAELGDDHENAAFVLDPLAPHFDSTQLDARLVELASEIATRRETGTTIRNLRNLVASSYQVEFPAETELSERVLWPQAPAESHGMEDARFVRFCDDDGHITYYGTYTAYDGRNIAQHLVTTTDFAAFTVSPMAGPAAVGKGLALFPRRVGGRFAALSRSDRETNAVAFSDDLHCWPEAEMIQAPTRPWEILQLGNCGSPIETQWGWLMLTHGVGPMRTYSLGALLLDLDDPRTVLAGTESPILAPALDRRDGYVPNVIYSCGGFAHGDTLVLPYAIGDQSISIATLSLKRLVSTMQAVL